MFSTGIPRSAQALIKIRFEQMELCRTKKWGKINETHEKRKLTKFFTHSWKKTTFLLNNSGIRGVHPQTDTCAG